MSAHPPPPPLPPLLPPYWWTAGLSLRERLPCPHPPTDTGAHERAREWRDGYLGDVGDLVAARLAASGTDEAELLAAHAEPARSLGARVAEPAWARFVEDAIAGAPAEQETVAGDGSWRAWFGVALDPFVAATCDHARELLAMTQEVVDHAGADAALRRRVRHRLVTMAARTLVFELNEARIAGTLTGTTPRERFAGFAARVGRPSELARLVGDYPVLARLIGQFCLGAAESHVEVLTRFAADRAAIVAALCAGDPGRLVDIEYGVGDPHQHGRAVAMLRFAAGDTVVYKPRPLGLHRWFTEVVHWFDGRLGGLGLRCPAVLERDGYGWLEFVATDGCADAGAVAAFYRRLGALLAMLHALNGTDMHCENLIAAGDQPVLVDVETLLAPRRDGEGDGGPAHRAYADSVLRTSVLPQLFIGADGAIDISALGAERGGVYPTSSVGWVDAGTDTMRLVRRLAPFPGAANRPVLDGEPVDPRLWAGALIDGFRAGHAAIGAHTEELAALLSGCAAPVRVVLRPTRTYARLLDESTHPVLLRDALDRDRRLFDALWTEVGEDPVRHRLVPHELTELWDGDIPLFSVTPEATDLCTGTGDVLASVFLACGRAAALTRLAGWTATDRVRQEWLISAALASRAPVSHRASWTALERPQGPPSHGPDRPADDPTLLRAANRLADAIAALAVRSPDGEAGWLGIELVEDRYWSVAPMGIGLGAGVTGVAVFLAQLAALTSVDTHRELAVAALRPVPGVLKRIAARPELAVAAGAGAHLGLGGVCYALGRLVELLDGEPFADWLDDALRVMPAADAVTDMSVATGLAGGLASMIAVHARTGSTLAEQLGEDYARALLRSSATRQPGVPTGFSTGLAGVAWALARYAAVGNDDQSRVVACRLSEQVSQSLAAADDQGWCRGAAGLLVAGRECGTVLPDGVWRRLADAVPLTDLSPCHGELGVLEALFAAGEPAGSGCRSRASTAAAAAEQLASSCRAPGSVGSPGVLNGMAGIGYQLLRIGFPQLVPSLMLVR